MQFAVFKYIDAAFLLVALFAVKVHHRKQLSRSREVYMLSKLDKAPFIA